MTLFPLLSRELHAAARQPFTYSLRVIGVVVAMVVVAFFVLDPASGRESGARLFTALHQTLLIAIWIFVPFLTADSISREKREGTLPLLSLTTVRPVEIALAKTTVHVLRALSLWLTVLPVMSISLLMGGVAAVDMLLSATIHFSSLCLAAGAGLLASSLSRVFNRAIGFTLVLSAFMFMTLLVLVSLTVLPLFNVTLLFEGDWLVNRTLTLLFHGFAITANVDRAWQYIQIVPNQLEYAPPILLALSLLLLGGIIYLVGKFIQRSWTIRIPAPWVIAVQNTFCRPRFFQRILKAWMTRTLQTNPVGWLEHRTWSSRLVMWCWFAVMISVYTSVLSEYNLFRRGLGTIQHALAWLLGASMAMSAAGSFRRERETGVLELLLVSPLRESQIITGRLRGLWAQFIPAVTLWVVMWMISSRYLFWEEAAQALWSSLGVWLVTLATLPMIGLYFSLACRSFVTAFLLTFVLGQILPLTFHRLLPIAPPYPSATWQLLLSTVLVLRLHHNLTTRRFNAARN